MNKNVVLLRSPSFDVFVDTGTVGPSHDPYAYTDTTVVFKKDTRGRKANSAIRIHHGISSYVKEVPRFSEQAMRDMDGQRFEGLDEARFRTAQEYFNFQVGFTEKQLDRWWGRYLCRCSKCNNKVLNQLEGFPGETFYQCPDCGKIMGYEFNESAVI
tara:strand:- start:3373 stop:3843 length:471 start_codon:yes stop_codon:yes gene_type:complete